MFDTIGEIKSPLLFCFIFEMNLNSWLLSQKCRQRKRTSLRDGLRLPSNSALEMIRRQFVYEMKPEGSFYIQIQILYSLRITTCNQHEVHNLTRLFCYNNTKWLIGLGREKVSFENIEFSSILGRTFFH